MSAAKCSYNTKGKVSRSSGKLEEGLGGGWGRSVMCTQNVSILPNS